MLIGVPLPLSDCSGKFESSLDLPFDGVNTRVLFGGPTIKQKTENVGLDVPKNLRVCIIFAFGTLNLDNERV